MSPTGISEIVLVVKDVLASARFYRDAVGLVPERGADDSWAWFWAGEPGVKQRVALRKGPLLFEEQSPHPEGRRWGQVHYALNVPRQALEAAVARVRENDVKVFGPRYFEWMRAESYYFFDPDGNLLEFWSPDPAPGAD